MTSTCPTASRGLSLERMLFALAGTLTLLSVAVVALVSPWCLLLSSAKEHWDRSQDPREAMVGGVAHSGRVVFAAAAVMVAVFLTFALSGPLPPKEMGVILGLAVLLDAALVRLLLVPVALRLLGSWAWWLPKPLVRILPDVRFGHA
jgi:putative drug exporter of the RND superfamily